MDIKQTLTKLANQPSNWKPWLPQNPNLAFMCCIGAGPWKFDRRQKIQRLGMTRLGPRDISDLSGAIAWFPLDWQNEMVNSLNQYLNRSRPPLTMYRLCRDVLTKIDPASPISARTHFYRVCGRPHGTKVLSLFLRDHLEVPSFPIDRHVGRMLKELGLPTKEDALLDACQQNGVDPIRVARNLGTTRLDGGNPDWSTWQSTDPHVGIGTP